MHTASNIYEREDLELEEITITEHGNPVEEYLNWKRSYALPAYRSYRIWVERFYSFAEKRPESLTLADFTGFSEQLRLQYSPKCVQFALSIIHNYLRFFSEHGRLRFPLCLARVPKAIARSNYAVSEAEYRAMIQTLKARNKPSQRNIAILMLLHDTGMRIGELCSLEIDDIEPDYSAVIRTEKTTARRRVFWNSDTDLVLQNYLVERVNSHPKTEKLFVAARDGRERGLSSRNIQKIIGETAERAGIKANVSPHSFRHALIHRLAKLGIPDALIAQLVGHSSPASIAPYTRLSRPEYEEVGRKQLAYALTA